MKKSFLASLSLAACCSPTLSHAQLLSCGNAEAKLSVEEMATCVEAWPDFIDEWKSKSQPERHRAALRVALDMLDLAQAKKPPLLDGDGKLPAALFDDAATLYFGKQIGLTVMDDFPSFSVGRKIVDKADFRAKTFEEKVPFLVSFRRDSLTDKSDFTILGDLEYMLTKSLALEQSLKASFDSSTGKPAKESSVDLGYEASRAWLGGDYINDLEASLGIEWNSDRRFKRSAYTASFKLTPSISALGAGYFNTVGRYTWTWQPTVAVEAGNVADAGGNEDLMKIKENGGFVRLVPGASLVVHPTDLPDLGFGLTYAHHYDLTQGWDRGLFTANVNYKLSDHAFVTAVFRRGHKKTTFEEIHDLLFGIGIIY